jgi:hypothetical protein
MKSKPVFPLISEMETDIAAISHWAGVLNHLGVSPHGIEADEVWVISNVLHDLGKRLDALWNEAFDAARDAR